MNKNVKNNIEDYQCPGCMVGGDVSCFEKNNTGGVGCGRHMAGTMIMGIGKLYLGMPKGFNHLGIYGKMIPNVYETFESSDWNYNMWNIPVWKYKNEKGHTFVRGIMPRKNEPFIHVYLENCIDKIECFELSQADIDGMD